MMGKDEERMESRYYSMTGINPDEQTLDHVIDTGDSESEAFLRKAIPEQGRGEVVETIRPVQERRYAVKKVGNKLLELQAIFLEMAMLVDSQSEHLDGIVYEFNSALSNVEKAVTELHGAKLHQRDASAWKCVVIILIILFFVLMLILPPLLFMTGARY